MDIPTNEELCFLSASELLTKFREGSTTPSEVLEHHFTRIDRTNLAEGRAVNAFTEELRDSAVHEARAADARYAAGSEELPPLLGVPIVSKEKHAIRGHWLTFGLGKEFGSISEVDQPIVTRIREAGAVLHGRTTTPEFSSAAMNHSGEWGVTRNPWNFDASPGGSSGGAGAALAAGYSTLATGSDIGGSTRIPAAYCGVVGYKAPYGRVPGMAPLAADWYRGDGPMGRSVEDVARLQSVMAGYDPSDHSSWGARNADYLSDVRAGKDGSLRGLRIAYSPLLGNYAVADSIRGNTEALIERLRAAGATVEIVEPNWTTDQILDTAFSHLGLIMGQAMVDHVGGDPTRLSPYAREFAKLGADYAGRGTIVDSLAKDAVVQAELARIMDGYDVLVTPSIAFEMLKADENYVDGITVNGEHFEHYLAGGMTTPFNIANRCPVMALPSGISSVGVPTSVQVVGHPNDEATVFRVSAAIELVCDPVDYPAL